jgi:hypothetical protein
MKIVGVLIEPRKVEQIFLNIDNFFKFSGLGKLYFFCGKNLKNYFINEITRRFNQYLNNIVIFELLVNNLTPHQYSDILKSKQTLNKIDSDYILTIQTDGCICENSKFKITDFLKYDYIGGYSDKPNWWKEARIILKNRKYLCLNGGFSLRKKASMLKVIEKIPPKKTSNYRYDQSISEYPEDLYYAIGMYKLGMNIGIDDEYSSNFCTHTTYLKNTYCVHKHNAYTKNTPQKFKEFLKYCPEFKNFIILKKI